MSWVCTYCSERHSDSFDTIGFGLCDSCREKVRETEKEKKGMFKFRTKKVFVKAKKKGK